MTFQWQFTQQDKDLVHELLKKHKGNRLLQYRVKVNLSEKRKTEVTKEIFWRNMIAMRLTAQQSSDPGSYVDEFNKKNPYPLAYETVAQVAQQEDISKFVTDTIKEHKAHYRAPTIGRQTAQNYYRLTEWGMWEGLLKQVNRLTTLQSKEVERSIATYLDFILVGISHKQSRNILQELGLTRYEIPIDSRVLNWLRDKTSFPEEQYLYHRDRMSNQNAYESLLDEIQRLCEACNEYPCLVDAAIFVDADKVSRGEEPNPQYNWPRPN